jgi:hypothetical protein
MIIPLPAVVAGVVCTIPAVVLAASRPTAATLASAAAAPLSPTLASGGPDGASGILRTVISPALFLGPVFLARSWRRRHSLTAGLAAAGHRHIVAHLLNEVQSDFGYRMPGSVVHPDLAATSGLGLIFRFFTTTSTLHWIFVSSIPKVYFSTVKELCNLWFLQIYFLNIFFFVCAGAIILVGVIFRRVLNDDKHIAARNGFTGFIVGR